MPFRWIWASPLLIIPLVMTIARGHGANIPADDQRSDPQFVQLCRPLVEKQWQFHQFHDQYEATHILIAQTGPDFFTQYRNGTRSKQDYHIGVAFIRKGGKAYDLTWLNCEIDNSGSAKISQGALAEQSSASITNELTGFAQDQLPAATLYTWVDPYVDQPGGQRARLPQWQPVGRPVGELLSGHEDTFPQIHGAYMKDLKTGQCEYHPPPPDYQVRRNVPCPAGM